MLYVCALYLWSAIFAMHTINVLHEDNFGVVDFFSVISYEIVSFHILLIKLGLQQIPNL